MGKSQIIHTDGEDLVVIARSDYEALLARAGDAASEDAMTARIVEATDAKIARGADVALPTAVWAAIESGEHPIRAIRKYRGLTQIEVAEKAGLRQGYIADIEAGKKTGSATSLKAVAGALGVPLDVIVG
jgi:DNA-binding XRE family transcriptional regulator